MTQSPDQTRPSGDAPAPEGGGAPANPLLKVAFLLMSGALMSKGLGFVREILMAQIIGVALVADGFRAAITLILLPLAFLQNESLPAILIPMQQNANAAGEAPRRLAALTIALTSIGVALTIATEIFAGPFVDVTVSGFSAEGHSLTTMFLHIMALAMPASVMLNCLAAGEISLGRTRITNARAMVLNVGVIGGLILLAFGAPVMTLGWAFAASFNGLAAWAVWMLWREGRISFSGLRPRMVLAEGREFLSRLRPFLGLPAAEQGAVWVERLVASRILTGAVASLDYARTLTDSALLLISQPLGLAVLSAKPADDQNRRIESLSRGILAFAIPFSAFLHLYSTDIVRLVFQRGAFGELGVQLTSHALAGIAIGLWASTLGWILLRVLNGAGRSRVTAVILISAHVANMGINLLSSTIHEGGDFGVFVIGLGDSARSFVLLGGVVLALGYGWRIMRLIGLALIPTAGMVALDEWAIQAIDGSFTRLLCGGVACVFTILVAEKILFPEIYTAVLSFIRNRRMNGRAAG